MDTSTDSERKICLKFGAPYVPSDDHLKVGISRDFDCEKFPINGLRHSPEGDTTGWYIRSGENFSTDPSFFAPLHARHLQERCPEILKYLGLGPGWRLLIAPGCEDVWFDTKLFNS